MSGDPPRWSGFIREVVHALTPLPRTVPLEVALQDLKPTHASPSLVKLHETPNHADVMVFDRYFERHLPCHEGRF